eukprot:UN01455
MNEEEDVESLFDDDDLNYRQEKFNHNIGYDDIAKPHDDFYINHHNSQNLSRTQNNLVHQQSQDDFGMINRNQSNNNYAPNISATNQNNHPRNTFSDGNLPKIDIWKNMDLDAVDISPRIPTSPKLRNKNPNFKHRKPRSNSFECKHRKPLPHQPINILLPYEKKQIAKKGKKKKEEFVNLWVLFLVILPVEKIQNIPLKI